MSELRFDGKVAVVTGAGGGLGKAYALLLGSRGAKVVVNDLGGSRDGSGKSSNYADSVVNEIKSKGGEAVADYNSVVEGEKIIKTALDNFGRIDILINNAGILRDRSFAKISEQRNTVPNLAAAQKWAGLTGEIPQSPIIWIAAKLGLVGLANTLAIEGAKYNIKVNTIVPTAASRLTEDILPSDMFQAMKPELIAPVVVYMVHESFDQTGTIIDSTLGFATKSYLVRGQGAHLRKKPTDPVTIESVREHWPQVVDMTNAKHLKSLPEVTVGLVEKNAVGASVSNSSELKYLYESHEEFSPLPTYFILAGMCMEAPLVSSSMPPGKHADFTNILHGEQYIEFVGDYPGTEGTFNVRCYVADILDKGSSAVAIVNSEIYLDKELVCRTQQHVFVVGQGGFGGPRTSKIATDVLSPPKRAPDAVVEQKTAEDQAAVYRLSGDYNPLHIDPNVATASGHAKPILHGLASLGFSARHVLIKYGGNNPANFKALKARFAKPVTPGQTLQTEMWLEGNRVFFQTKVKETGIVVISGAYVDLKNIVQDGTSSTPQVSTPNALLKSDGLFAKIQEEVKKNPQKAKNVGGVFLYNIMENGKTVKQWTLDLKSPMVHEGSPKTGKADTTLSVSDSDLLEIASGTLSPQVAYLKGKLKISGNLMLAQKLGPLLKSDAKL
ncbi:hypothetical protein EVAR_21553_1 [Eumeta japonica]|uniref:Peroxisomal multifunctional enzyme type 2 n=1 Tax=Eumeta variegata TaxID=151549 RepID=A0A4C1XPV2_EUMVA|nr:hypothetical protein EVAR_21553_1 [Eumeta japonica]